MLGIFAPRKVLEYVVVHEVVHLRHRSLGPEFWAYLGTLNPRLSENQKLARCPSRVTGCAVLGCHKKRLTQISRQHAVSDSEKLTGEPERFLCGNGRSGATLTSEA